MKLITLLPADSYIVINKTILTEIDRQNLISLYEPIVGALAISLYLTLWRDLDRLEIMSGEFTHHHLMTILKTDLETIKTAREGLEAMGLLKVFVKEGDCNSYLYELYSPLSATEFLNHPILNVVLYNNVGKQEYQNITANYQTIEIDKKDYQEITKTLNTTFKPTTPININNIKEKTTLNPHAEEKLDFDFIMASLPKGLVNDKTFNKKTRELINNLTYIYDLDDLQVIELLRTVITENSTIDKEALRKSARRLYQYHHDGTLPTLIYRKQPEYLKTPLGDTSNKAKIIYVFENTSPYDFLKSKNKGVKPTNHDLKIIESLILDLNLKPAVVNVLIDYVLKKNNNKLNQAFIETIAGQWKRQGIETAGEAMAIAVLESKKYTKKIMPQQGNAKDPVWFNTQIEKDAISSEESAELAELLKEFR